MVGGLDEWDLEGDPVEGDAPQSGENRVLGSAASDYGGQIRKPPGPQACQARTVANSVRVGVGEGLFLTPVGRVVGLVSGGQGWAVGVGLVADQSDAGMSVEFGGSRG